MTSASNGLLATAASRATGASPAGPAPFGLTACEQRVMDLVVDGMTSKEIGRQLGVSFRTAENHSNSARKRMGAPNITRAAVLWDRTRRAA